MHGSKSRKLHYAKQIAWNLPMYKINGSLLSLILPESAQLSWRSGLTPYIQYFMGGQTGNILQILSNPHF